MERANLLKREEVDLDVVDPDRKFSNHRDGPRTKSISSWLTYSLLGVAIICIMGSYLTVSRPEVVVQKKVSAFPEIEDTEDEYSSASYTKRVRKNIQNLMKKKDVLLFQPNDQPRVRPLVPLLSNYLRQNKYNMTFCMVPKAMATTNHAIFCYLEDTQRFMDTGSTFSTFYWNDPLCNDTENIITSTASLPKTLPIDHVSFFIVREPIRKFVSAFVNKCIYERRGYAKDHPTWRYCYGCEEDLDCVIKSMHDDIKNRSSTEHFLIGTDDDRYFSEHFYPMSWLCNLGYHGEDLDFIRYVSSGPKKAIMVNDLVSLMKKSGVDEAILKNISSVLLDDTPLTHATRQDNLPKQILQQIYNSAELLEYLTNVYYYDFVLFEYPLPQLGKPSDEFD